MSIALERARTYALHEIAVKRLRREMRADRCLLATWCDPDEGDGAIADVWPCFKRKIPINADPYFQDGARLPDDACDACRRNETRLAELYALRRRSGGLKRAFLAAFSGSATALALSAQAEQR